MSSNSPRLVLAKRLARWSLKLPAGPGAAVRLFEGFRLGISLRAVRDFAILSGYAT